MVHAASTTRKAGAYGGGRRLTMPPRQHSGGDGGQAGRRSLLLRPSLTVRMSAQTRALLGVLAAVKQVSVSSLCEAWITTAVHREIAELAARQKKET
jgi:hypothetical protein